MLKSLKKILLVLSEQNTRLWLTLDLLQESSNCFCINSLSKYNFNKDDEVIVPALGWSTSFSPLRSMELN